MKPTSIIQRLVILLITLMSAIGANAQEAYACYTESNTTLTFYYDNQRSSRDGTTYDLKTVAESPDWYTEGIYTNVTNVVFDSSFSGARPTTTYGWFSRMGNLQTITDIGYLNTNEVTSMASMFASCKSLKHLDLSNFNTAKLTDTRAMFANCTNLITIYVGSGWNTANVTSSNSTLMFYNCTSLQGGQNTTYNANHVDAEYAHIDGGTSDPGYLKEKWKERYVVYTQSNLTLTFYFDNLRTSRINTGKTYDLNTGSDLPDWITDKSTSYVTKVVFDPSFAGARPSTTSSWFHYLRYLETIEGLCYLNTSAVDNMSEMFYFCESLTTLDLSNFNTSDVYYMGSMFEHCDYLTTLDLSSFNTSMVTDMKYMFEYCKNLRTIYVGDGWTTSKVRQSDYMFRGCTSLEGAQGTTYDASNVDKEYAHIDGGSGNPGYLCPPREAYACYTSSNTTLTFYYDNDRSSRSGATYDLNTGGNTAWKEDGISSYITKVVFDPSFVDARPTTTYAWFYEMKNLQSITGMGYLNTSEVTNMSYMFYYCSRLTSLDLSTFNTSKVTHMNCMFEYSQSLRTIFVGDGWTTNAVTNSDDMFFFCTSIVGGQETTYNDNYTDATYAHVDGGKKNPGYFSEKPREAYACYTPRNTTLTFYYDKLRSSRSNTYDLNTDNNKAGWQFDGMEGDVTDVVFDPSFADARPTTTYAWFSKMTNLQNIEGMSYLNTSEVTNMAEMFYKCTKITSLDLSSFNTNKVTQMSYMFNNCAFLRTVYVGDGWNTDAVTTSNYMFYSNLSLKGGKGTTWSSTNPMDKTYARIDGEGVPGYFTRYTIGIATDLHQVSSDKSQVQSDEWYTIDGQKLSGKPAKKGVYIQNGQKRIIK